LTGWVTGNTISLIANLIFFILNVLFFSAFSNTLAGKNDANKKLIPRSLKVLYQVFLFSISAIVLAIVVGGAISKDSFSNIGNYLLVSMTYSIVFALIIVLLLLFFSGVKLATNKNNSSGSGRVMTSFVIIGIVSLSLFLYLFYAGKIPSTSTLTIIGLLGFFITSAMYYLGETDNAVNTNKESDKLIGFIAYCIMMIETVFGLFFPYLYFMIILILRLITGVVMKTTYWTLIPFYIVSFMSKTINSNKVETIIGVTDYNMFKNNFLCSADKSGVNKLAPVAVIALIIIIFVILLSMGI
jgi:hypothetical protein